MARIRTIKPDFFRHEALQDLETAHPGQHVMLVFAALWGHCDKAGRFPWKPRSLKLDILPFLDFDLSASLVLLWEAGLIERYESGGDQYGFIPTFNEHQRLTGKEAQEPPKYPDHKGIFLPRSRGNAGEAPGKHSGSQEGKGREGKGMEWGADAPPPSSSQRGGEYAWEGNIIRLLPDQYDRWRKSYHGIPDYDAELQKADDFYAENPPDDGRWFFPVSRWLERAHKQALEKTRNRSPEEERLDRFIERAARESEAHVQQAGNA